MPSLTGMSYRTEVGGPTITVTDRGPDADVGPGGVAQPVDAGFFGAFFLPFDSLRLSRPLAMFSPFALRGRKSISGPERILHGWTTGG